MTIETKRSASGRISLKLDGKKISLDNAAKAALSQDNALILINENSDTCLIERDDDLMVLGEYNLKYGIRQFAKGEKVTGATVLNHYEAKVVKANAEESDDAELIKHNGLSLEGFLATNAGLTVEEYLARKAAKEAAEQAEIERNTKIFNLKDEISNTEYKINETSGTLNDIIKNHYNPANDDGSWDEYTAELGDTLATAVSTLETLKAQLAEVEPANINEELIDEYAISEAAMNVAVEAEENAANNLPTGNITVNNGTEAWAIVGKYFPNGINFNHSARGYNREDSFRYTNDEIIYVVATCTPDNSRVECIEVINTYESGSARHILTVYINRDANTLISITQYKDLLAWAEKVSNGQADAVTQIKTHCAAWLNADVDKQSVIDLINTDGLNGFRNFLAQFNFAVKDDAGYINKLYTYDGNCVLAEIPSCEYSKYSTDANEEIINCTDDIITSDAAYTQMIDTELYNAARAAGNYSVTINGEAVTFENHKIVSIDAKNRFGLNMRVVNGKKQFRRYNYVIARATVAKMYMNSELAQVQEKKFREFFIKDGAAKSGFFAVKVYATLADDVAHIYANYFDAFNQARDFVASVKEFVGNVQCEIYIQRDEQCGKIYYKRDAQGNETYDLPDTDFFKGTPAAEIQARIDELKKAHADNAQYKDNPDVDGYVWSELCVANADIEKTIEYYEFILHENALVTTAEIDGTEEDENNEAFNLLPSVDELNDVEIGEIEEVKVGEEIVEYHGGKFFGVHSPKYGASIHYLPNGEMAFKTNPLTHDKKSFDFNDLDRWSEEDFFSILAERGAVTFREKPQPKPADNFAAELDRLTAEVNAATATLKAAQEALKAAELAAQEANNKLYELMTAATDTLNEQINLPAVDIDIKTADGYCAYIYTETVSVVFDVTKFIIWSDGCGVKRITLGNYDTPAQVQTVISRLKAAIERGDKKFTFPTIDELNAADTPTANDTLSPPYSPIDASKGANGTFTPKSEKSPVDAAKNVCREKSNIKK